MMRFKPERCDGSGIQKGFHPLAQGCDEEATLGYKQNMFSTLKGLEREISGVPSAATLSGLNFICVAPPRVARASQPWAECWNPIGIR